MHIYNEKNLKDIKKIVKIVFDYKANEKCIIKFSSEVEYIHPLFFILLFDKCRSAKKDLILDICHMEKNVQNYVHRFLTQYTDYEFFKIYTLQVENNETDLPYKEHRNNTYSLFTSIYHEKSWISLNNTILPIIRLRAFDREYERLSYHTGIKGIQERKSVYDLFNLSASIKMNEYEKSLLTNIDNMLDAIGIGKKSLSLPFMNLFSELIGNIQKHTSDDETTNAHLSFYRDLDPTERNIKLIVSDNYKFGFLDKYLKTLKCEKYKLREKGIDTTTLEPFTTTIQDLKKGEFEKTLKGLFGIDNVTEHQIPRIVMHFGIPIILRVLQKLLQESQKAKLEILVNSVKLQQYFLVETTVTKESINVEVVSLNDEKNTHKNLLKFDGTHIIISIPIDIREYETDISDIQSNLNMSNNDFISLLSNNNYEDIQKEILKYQYLHAKHIHKNVKIDSDRVIVKYTDFEKNTFSDFVRALYLYAYQHTLVAVVVYNVPSKEFKAHLKMLYLITYIDEDAIHNTSLDIVFYDATSPQAMFIGGRNQKEFCALNYSLGNSIEDLPIPNNVEEVIIESPLAYNLKYTEEGSEHKIILPFELFQIYDSEHYDDFENSGSDTVEIFKDMVINFLNEYSIPMLVDTQNKYYLEKYYQFRMLFQSSLWTHRIAFQLAKLIGVGDKQYQYIIGTDKYTAPLISILRSYLDSTIKYEIMHSGSQRDWDLYSSQNTLILSPVALSGKNIEKNIYAKINPHEEYSKDWFNVIRIKIDTEQNHNDQIKSCYFLNISQTAKDISSRVSYKIFFEVNENWRKPLYTLDSIDSFEISSFYRTDYRCKQIRGYTQKNNFIPKWVNSAYFGHVIRGDNHYAFYTKTIHFLEDNRLKVQSFLKEVKNSLDISNSDKSFIVAPMHHTNNNFTSFVNKEVFNNDATVLSLDKTKGEANFHIDVLKSVIDGLSDKIKIYFVDDEISSIGTLQYHFSWIQTFFGFEKEKLFDGIITLIDRASRESEIMLGHYVVEHDVNTRFLPFTTLEIKPIKSVGNEECFLCKRKKEYQSLIGYSSLDLTRFELAEKILKLKELNAKDIDNNEEVKYRKKVKDFIKMYAVHFVYQHFDYFTTTKKYEVKLNEFKTIIFESLYEQEYKHYGLNPTEKEVLQAIFHFESEIAIIKALSFPKLSFYKSIRDTIALVLKKYISVKVSKFEKILLIENEATLDSLMAKVENEKKEFLEDYREKSNLHMANLHFSVLGYLGDPYLLGQMCLALYTQMVELDHQDINIKHGYLLAVKMVISGEKDLYKAKYLEDNLNEYERDSNNNDDVPHLLRAMFIENNIITRKVFKLLETTETFMSYMNDAVLRGENEQVTSLYINENLNKSSRYIDYLKKTQIELVDILNDYQKINNDSRSDKIKMLYFGAVSDRSNVEDGRIQDVLPMKNMLDDLSEIDDTWANYYCKESNSTIIRLVDVDDEKKLLENISIKENSPIWFKPIGCIVVKHDEEDVDENGLHYRHKYVVNKVLANQKTIVEFIKKQTTTEVVKLRYENRVRKEQEEKWKVEKQLTEKSLQQSLEILSNISHSYSKFINMKEALGCLEKYDPKKVLEMVGWFSLGLQYVFELSMLTVAKKPMSVLKWLPIPDDFQTEMKKFAQVSSFMINDCIATFELNLALDKTKFRVFSMNQFKIVIFELLFNIIKVNMKSYGIIEIEIVNKDKNIYIANTGKPFRDDYKPIFQGEKISYDSKENNNGLGLGLKRIVDYLKSIYMTIEVIENKPVELQKYEVVLLIKPQ